MWFAGLLPTGEINAQVLAVRDGLVNMYVIRTADSLVCIDAGWRPANMLREFVKLKLDFEKVVAVFLTHLHWDHARCAGFFPKADIYISKRAKVGNVLKRNNIPSRWKYVSDNRLINISGLKVFAIHTPGHTSDSVSYLINDSYLFTGDTLHLKERKVTLFSPRIFNRNNAILAQSIYRLANIKGVTNLFTAHTGMTSEPELAFLQWRDCASPGEGVN